MRDLNMTHQCPVCLKQFEFVSKLRRHQLTHSGQKPFACSICQKTFRQTAHLKRHLESHAKLSTAFVSGAADPCTYAFRDVPRVGPEMSVFEQPGVQESPELVDQSVWYNVPQTHGESGWKGVDEESVKKERLEDTVHALSVIPPSLERNHLEDKNAGKQVCDMVQWNCGDMAEKENDCHQNGQRSWIQPGTSPEKEQPGVICSSADAAASTNSHKQASQKPMEETLKKHQCTTCLKCFSAPSKLQRHVLIHTSQRPFACQLCPKAFRQLAHLKIHLTTHFSQRQTRTKHKSQNTPSGHGTQIQGPSLNAGTLTYVHASEEPWEAKDGPTLTGTSKENSVDVETHPEDADKVTSPFETLGRNKVMHECPVCFKCFSAPSKLRRHCLIHTGQRPFQCSMCYRSFRQLAHLKAHYSVHTAVRKKTTPLQLHRFVNQPPPSKARLRHFVGSIFGRDLRLALQANRPKISSTPVPSRATSFSTSLKPRSVPETDTSCVTSTANRDNVDTHSNWCTVCSKHFSAPSKLSRHLLIHTGQKPFKCLVCFRAFTQKSHLKVHRCRVQSPGAASSTSSKKLVKHGPSSSRPSITFAQGAVNGQQHLTVDDNTDSFIPSDSFTPAKWEDGALPHGASENVTFAIPGTEAMEQQSKESGHQCAICLKMFDFPSKLSRHLLIHMDLKPFTCSVCRKSFRQLCHLKSHEKVHMARRKVLYKGILKRRLAAPKAAVAFKTSRVLKESCGQDSGSLPLLQKPETDFSVSGDNTVINESATSEEPAEEPAYTTATDNTVKLAFNINNSRQALKTGSPAKRSHKKRDVNQCTFCFKTFEFPSKLSRHLRIHTGVRPYECHICHKSFNQLSHLQCHQWVHSRKVKNLVKKTLEHVQPEKTEDFPMEHQQQVQGHDSYPALEQHPNWSPREFGPTAPDLEDLEEGKIKSEIDLQVDRSASIILKNETCTSVIGADGVSRSLDWDGLDQPPEQEDPRKFEEVAEVKHPQDVHSCVPEDCSNRSPTVSDSCRLGFSREQPERSDFRGQTEERPEEPCVTLHTEPPNDLPICPGCSQCFPTMKKLHTHKCQMVASPEARLRKSYQCAVCFKSFEAPSKLKRHYVIHTGQRPYQCTICNKSFTQSGHLKTHLVCHR